MNNYLNPALNDYPAFQWCNARGYGWYLPAINELSALRSAWNSAPNTFDMTGISGTNITGDIYWSSRETGVIAAERFNFSNATISSQSKFSSSYVRAVLAF